MDATMPESQLVEAELEAGAVSPRFHRHRQTLLDQLSPLVAASDFVIAHNAFSLHFNLPLSAALWDLSARRAPGTVIAWCHDLAWVNPLYAPAMHDGYPWDLLRAPAPNVQYVTISEQRKIELLALWHAHKPRNVLVIPNGIDAGEFLRLTPRATEIVERFHLLDRDIVLLLTVRITRRKNIELGIQVIRELTDRKLDACFLVSGPQAPHHPARSTSYLDELKAVASRLGVADHIVFLADSLGETQDYETVAQLYSVADVLLFPSQQEGFGIPVLEAAMARVPAVLSDIPIFREIGGEETLYFNLQDPPGKIADSIREAVAGREARFRKRVLRTYRWDIITDKHIVPLLER
jgi:mannosylglucosylglycerate synthase